MSSRHNLGLFVGLSSGLASRAASAAFLPTWSDLVSALQPQKVVGEYDDNAQPQEFSFLDDEGTMLDDEGTARLGFVQVKKGPRRKTRRAEIGSGRQKKSSKDKWKPMSERRREGTFQ